MKPLRIIFLATPEIAVPILETLHHDPRFQLELVITQPDRKSGRHQIITPSAVKQYATTHQLPYDQPANINSATSLETIRRLQPDIILVLAYAQLLSPDLLAIPRFGCINIHGSLLPRYRGASPVQQAILDGESQTGITFMLMDAGLDTGQIITQHQLLIEPTDTTATLFHKLSQLASKHIADTLLTFTRDQITPQPQDDSLATQTKLIHKKDGLIDWHLTAEQIIRQLHAYTPWPGIYTFLANKRLLILQASLPLADDLDYFAKLNHPTPPGQILSIRDHLYIATADQPLLIERLQLAGKKPVSGIEFLKSYPHIISQTCTSS